MQKVKLNSVYIVLGIVILISMIFSFFSVWRLVMLLPKENFDQKLRGSIAREGDWFVHNQKPEGDFNYETVVSTGELREGNNIVRQAGALYGIAQSYSFTKNKELKKVLEKGFAYFKNVTTTPSAGETNTVALLVLGLVEYLEVDTSHQTTEYMEYLMRLSDYLVSTQRSSGAYINAYTPKEIESDYNNGETMYALIRSYRLTQKETHLLSVKRMANYAIYYYGKQKFNASFFSWGMAGFSYLYAIDPDPRYVSFLKINAGKYMENRGSEYEQFLSGKNNDVIPPGSAVFLEGVNHVAWAVKEKDPTLYKKLKQHVQSVLKFLFTYEIGSPYGKFTSLNDQVYGAVCSQATCETTRIDFIQHHMSAMLLYLKFLK